MEQQVACCVLTYAREVDLIIERNIFFELIFINILFNYLFIIFWLKYMCDLKTEYSTSTQHTKILQTKIQNLKNRDDTTGRVNVKLKI